MAQVISNSSAPIRRAHANSKAVKETPRVPLKYSGSLDSYKSFDITPIIGREFPDVQLSTLLSDDRKLRDLAILVSQRGVVFFRNQDLEIDQQRVLGEKLGRLSGKPETSKLHRHAMTDKKAKRVVDGEPKPDEEVMVISSENAKLAHQGHVSPLKPLASTLWHSDITFEHVPSDYAVLKMTIVPETGGDTIWASGYEAYDRLSPAWKRFAESLTATHHNATLKKAAQEGGEDLISGDRGSPDNGGLDFEASHPVVRTNPVTGWKSLMAAGHQVHDGKFNNVTPREDEILKSYFLQLIAENHDLQVRFKWRTNDIAIWDNRSCFHTATFDYDANRSGNRIVSIGEKPYLDPNSTGRRFALAKL
ncbi:putative TfdA family taurine dioxygenase [Mytilinidion resinicola]|uniref:TfdA family taurine dioxygenase n=1 Tax=Mytilinidion resinicola TaxID=574789 RepID=A0A6A6Z3Y7_9PEZI|nr:putative TfdA family taurine dioxygenase [Mytilinidion resinicola]KAF2815363.1 putative TfdA family taurine dioxygenase [Mytilinidion resinicola]